MDSVPVLAKSANERLVVDLAPVPLVHQSEALYGRLFGVNYFCRLASTILAVPVVVN